MKIGLNRKIANIEVCDKIFKIGIFPIACESLIVKHDMLDKEFEKIKKPSVDELNGKNEAQYEIQFEILENLLIANGYEFDRKWWETHLDVLGILEFIITSKSKDIVPDTLKKKEVIQGRLAT